MVNDTINHSLLLGNIPGSGFDSGLRLSSFDLGMSRADINFSSEHLFGILFIFFSHPMVRQILQFKLLGFYFVGNYTASGN